MEDALPNREAGERAVSSNPPPPPDPSHDASTAPADPAVTPQTNEPLRLTGENWDICSVSALAALRMLTDALEDLAEAMGDVPPTPPVSRPSTPSSRARSTAAAAAAAAGNRAPTSPPTARGDYPSITIGSPEAHPHEPVTVVGANAEAHYIQHAAIARRFFSKLRPPFSIAEYLGRLHHWCAHSAGVYLAAATYVQRLCVADASVPATHRTIHRLALAAIRVAAKALEDNKWPQDRIAKVGGVSKLQLMNLEVTLCFLLDFDLWVDDKVLARGMFLLQQAARQGSGTKGKLGEQFQLKLPILRKKVAAIAMT